MGSLGLTAYVTVRSRGVVCVLQFGASLYNPGVDVVEAPFLGMMHAQTKHQTRDARLF